MCNGIQTCNIVKRETHGNLEIIQDSLQSQVTTGSKGTYNTTESKLLGTTNNMGVFTIFLIFVVASVQLEMVSAALNGLWDNDIFTGRHWDDLVTPRNVTSSEVIQPALLLMYRPNCRSPPQLIEPKMPQLPYLFFGKFDTVTTLKHIWYDIDERDNLTARYKPKNCYEYLFFAKGSNVYQPDVYNPKSGMEVIDWVWGKFAVALSIGNYRREEVKVDIHGERPQEIVLRPGEVQIVPTFVSNIILISDSSEEQLIHGMVVEEDSTSLNIMQNMEVQNVGKIAWLEAKQEEMRNLWNETRTWLWGLANNNLRNFKLPLLLPVFTKEGYYKTKIPNKLFQEILTFYKANIRHRKHELQKSEPLINERDVRCTLVGLSNEMINHIGDTLRPLLEEWSKTKLMLTRLYGVREYYKGNILSTHVDRVSTHVISAILQIDQVLDGKPEWELEMITRDGKRKHMALKTGEMLFYESATVIHGRPKPFQGKIYANAFLHYRPIDNWKWHMHPDGHWIMNNGHPKEVIDQLMTAITVEKPKFYYHDEL